jgi:hypothetical protein
MITVIGIKSKFGTYLLSRVQIIRSRARCRSRLWQEDAARSPRQPLAGRVKEQGTLVKVARGVAASVGSNSGFLVNPRTRRQTPLRQAICAERKPQAGCPPIRESHVSGAPGRHNARQLGPACDAVPPHNAREKSGRHAKFPPEVHGEMLATASELCAQRADPTDPKVSCGRFNAHIRSCGIWLRRGSIAASSVAPRSLVGLHVSLFPAVAQMPSRAAELNKSARSIGRPPASAGGKPT